MAAAGSGMTVDPEPPTQPPQPAYTYQQKYTRCNKSSCRRCGAGPGHGPYWYAFWWEGGRTRSRYIGKVPPATLSPHLPSSAPAAASPVPALRVATMGRFAVWRHEEPLPVTAWPRRKAAALFKLLLSVPGHRLMRDQILDLLWPDEDPRTADVGLRAATFGVRRALDESPGVSVLQVRDGVLSLADSLMPWVDAEIFAIAAHAALAGRDIELCRVALVHYAGEYLPDERYADWAERRRQELAALRASVLLHQSRLCAEHGDLAEACSALTTLLAIDVAHEEAACRLMTLLAAKGERTEALRVYERLRGALREQYEVEPGKEIADLAARLRAEHRARAAGRPARPSPRHTNLPAAQNSFIGRHDAREAVGRALDAARLVTLTGAGGSGKTRLALQVAESTLDQYPDGVWLCQLAGLARPVERTSAGAGADQVAIAVAGALGLVEDPTTSPAELIAVSLAPRRLLLLLDNCEHMLDPVAGLVATILARCPRVTVLVTSQEALGLPGEVVWTVPPLDLPLPGQPHTPERLAAFDAIRLFVDRAHAARPGFALNDATAPLVLEICRRLDGLPLAIELAAARLAFLALEDVAARLDDRFRLLVGGSRVALPRQQTLLAAMDWSYSLLGAKEGTLLRRLSVFAGGWTLDAAEGICADADLPRETILETLGGLVAKSLVTVDEDADETVRYAMLETVRQYGQARLAERKEAAVARGRHLAWLAQHCEDALANWSATDQAGLLRHLDADLANIRAALTWGFGPRGNAVSAVRLACALWSFWLVRGHVSEGRSWMELALKRGGAVPDVQRAAAFHGCAVLAAEQGDYARAAELFEGSLALARGLGDLAGVGRERVNLGVVALRQGDYARAEALIEEGLPQMEGEWSIAAACSNLGLLAFHRGDYARAEELMQKSLALHRERQDGNYIASSLNNLALVACAREDYARAEALLSESIALARTLESALQIIEALEGLALLRGAQGAAGMAARMFGAAEAARAAIGTPMESFWRDRRARAVVDLRAALGEEAFTVAWTEGRALSPAAALTLTGLPVRPIA